MSISADEFTREYLATNTYLTRYIGSLLHRCPHLAASVSAEDVAQTVWTAIWRKRDQFNHHAALRTWACSIALNEVREVLRRAGRRVIELSADITHAIDYRDNADPERALFAKLYAEQLLRACSRRQASALRSRFFDGGLTGAGHTDLDRGRLKVDTHRGIERIRQRIAGVELKQGVGVPQVPQSSSPSSPAAAGD